MPDGIQLQRRRRMFIERVDVSDMLGGRQGCRHGSGRQLQPIGAAGQHRLVGHPHDGGAELVGNPRRGIGGDQPLPARAIDLVRQRQGDSLPGHRLRQVGISTDDPSDPARPSGRHHPDCIPRANPAGGHCPGKAPEVEIGTVDPLHRHPERRIDQTVAGDFHSLQMIDQRRPLVPIHVG